ncbi:CocE/NonD family hydrolase [Pseudemcibacter aquimaris]|uniref:CocE/NonD family hydrolase n=1 Tax=Pseudemcibacter aquimaris TaxID=2857064 RepID=UPI002013A5B5|nr:CocE/NonD family hydrolase [Pseudemcibacter aquimaris]MCC3861024.1 CocE/NonD family hydrolase [Pseudemcibacter aquimaris]WDU59842.1 CocE/NonD family hydrolase [Pseudemcibacter aquimaris]
MQQLAKILLIPLVLMVAGVANADDYDVREHYTKHEYAIPMRDGTKVFTAVYTPKDKSREYPFLMVKTPYSISPYGVDNYPTQLGPSGGDNRFAKEGYIFVYQDVRGRYMSEGEFKNMTPHIADKKGPNDVDESSDMYDTVEYLLENVKGHNGKVGIFGISYRGFYAAASVIDSHPAIKASSPQAPMADIYYGDDFHHRGAFFLLDAFRFFRGFDQEHNNPTKQGKRDTFQFPGNDAYKFFLELGALHNVNDKIFKGESQFWNRLMEHPNYDEFWQSRHIVPHLKNVNANVMTVIGSFDAEDSYGGTAIYEGIEKNNPGIDNMLVRGPWFHGGWVRSDGTNLGNVRFNSQTSKFYKENIDLKFFNHYLKGGPDHELPEMLAFYTGENEWREHSEWPAAEAEPKTFYMTDTGGISNDKPTGDGYDEWVSDPANPVPYTRAITNGRSREYMVEDQRFVEGRPDVMVYETEVLTEDLTMSGPIVADLYVSTTGTDADFVVKVIDVFPNDFPEHENKYMDVPMPGYQMMVRGEVIRGKYRNSMETPEPFTPGEVTQVKFTLPDITHTFKQGHKLMIQIQSSWFPLVDRNPQQFLNIYEAKDEDYIKATHQIHTSDEYPSSITVGVIE